MKKTLLFLICLITWLAPVQAQNLVAGWDGNGKTGAGSEPNQFGWDCTNLQAASWTQAGAGGVRYMDNAYAYCPGRLLFVRWDGVGGTNATSIYSYPVALELGKAYRFTMKYTHHSNSKTDFTIGVNSKKDNTGESLASGTLVPNTQSFKEAEFKIVPSASMTYYITIGSPASGMLGSITDLSVQEMEAKLECSESAINLNFFSPEKAVVVYPNGSKASITFSAPEGIKFAPESLPSSGGTVTISSPANTNTAGTITVQQGTDKVEMTLKADFPADFLPQQGIDTLTQDGAWCWFADPRAIYYEGEKKQTYFSWITTEGDIVVASYNHETGEYNQKTVWAKWQSDDHDNPSLLIRDDGRLIIFFAKHFGPPIKRCISTNPEDITSWGEDYELGNNVTYPYPFRVGKTIYVLYRGESSWHPHMVVSTDNGETFGATKEFIAGGGQRPYTRYCQGADGAIHVAVTTGHPRNEASNKIYYCRFKDNKFYKADGTLIKDFADGGVNISQLEVVYNGTTYGKGWIWDIAIEKETGNPVMVYASFPSDTDHRYHYARWNGTAWENTQITEAGKWFPQTPAASSEPEPNYSGGIIMDYDDPSVVYLSKEVKGVFEIFKYVTADQGKSWTAKAITWNTPSHLVNVRPIVPRHHKEGFFDVIWMRGEYVFYANQQYETALVFPSMGISEELESIRLSAEKLEMLKGESKQLSANLLPFFTGNKTIVWSSSDEKVATVTGGKVVAIGAGKATITATGHNGVKATCEVMVEVADYFYDFGTATSPLSEGAVRVTEATLWGAATSFGWVSPTGIASRLRTGSWNDEEIDFVLGPNTTVFRVKVDAGDYKIVLKQGDTSYAHDKMTVKVNDVVKLQDVTSNSGEILVSIFNAKTDDGIFNFEISRNGVDANWVINSLRLIKTTAVGLSEAIGIEEFQDPNTLISVFDVDGKILFREKMGERDLYSLLTERGFLSGTYLINLSLGQKQKTIKLALSQL